MSKLNVLQLCNKPPRPAVDGGCIAINNISIGLLNNDIDLQILTISTEKHPFDLSNFTDSFISRTAIDGVFIDTRVNIIDAFSSLVTSDSYNISRFFSPDYDKRLREILTETVFDIVHLESLFMTPYIQTIRLFSDAKIILRSHNLEHLIWERLADSTGNKTKKIYLKHLASKLKKYEKRTINEVDGIAAISFEDTRRFKKFKCKVPIITIPFGIDLEKYSPVERKLDNNLRLFHIGAMDWEPNKEAINWLLDDIWPTIKDEPIELHLAGKKMPRYILEQANDQLIVHNEVQNAIDFICAHDILIAPLLSGSGMRVKIIEAMGCGKTVVTTTIGAEGINYLNNENILIADTPEEFSQIIKKLIVDPQEVKRIGRNARNLVENEYDNSKIIKELIDFYKTISL